MVTTPTTAEVTTVYDGDPVGNNDLSSSDASDLIDIAVSQFDAKFSDRVLFTNETVDEANAVRYLAAHKWALALGDTVSSESQGGANATYNVSSATERSLSRTTYGQEFLEYLIEGNNIGVVTT